MNEKLNYENHREKCRICLSKFEGGLKKIQITQQIQKGFFDISGIELHLSSKFSNEICQPCICQLDTVLEYAKNTRNIQERIYRLCGDEEQLTIKLEQEEIYDPNSNDDDEWIPDLKIEKLPPIDVQIKPSHRKRPQNSNLENKKPKKAVAVNKKSITKVPADPRTCPFCNVRLSSAISKQRHIASRHEKVKKCLCDICGYRASLKYTMQTHMKKHLANVKSIHACHFCEFSAFERSLLTSHMVLKHPQYVFSCKCGTSFMKRTSLNNHIRLSHGGDKSFQKNHQNSSDQPASRQKVSITNEKKPSMQSSEKQSISKYDRICDICGYRGATQLLIHYHMKKHIEYYRKSLQKCKYCCFSTKEMVSINAHIITKHEDKVFPCQCGHKFISKNALDFHKREAHKGDRKFHAIVRSSAPVNGKLTGPQMCLTCGKIYASMRSLKNHIASKHEKVRKYFCDICGYGGCLKSQVQIHMKRHVKDFTRSIHKCSYCNFSSVSKNSLKVHVQTQHEIIVFTCHCGKEFKSNHSLKTHMSQVHQNVRNHSCHCGKTFHTSTQLKYHQQIEHLATSRDFPCDICGVRFRAPIEVTRHRRKHLLKFKCTHKGCSVRCTTQEFLTKHMKSHKGDRKNHQCHLCEKSYYNNKDLQVHLNVFHKAKTYFCELCEFSSHRREYLGNHLKSVHSILDLKSRSKIMKRAKIVCNNPV